ncbi:hypothetical protein GMST_31580 [Geomonas silvestris]|uniref:Uncharacterized protein n=1 Tax=Geomonas silvestris TaxID=2740184 RepID=A0A6V8MM66_9BACT|nr:hypothetical protein [Geomonas silvestris]GFO60833.1 hypothetical protein GMST_31580 [Geomonas silvestris]
MLLKRKDTFTRDFKQRHPLRFHMSAILVATGLSGVLASKLFLFLHIDSLVLRYPLAVLIAYLIFFLCVKLWLWHVTPRRVADSRWTDWVDVPTSSPGGGEFPWLHGGGGDFSGAGASASFDVDASIVSETPLTTVSESSSGIVDGVGEVVGEAAGALGEEAGVVGIVVLAALAAVVATVLGSAVYMIAEAPIILSEAAFEGILAASLVSKVRIIDDEDWIGSIVKTTWKPFMATFAVALIAAFILHMYFPEATKLSEVL